MTNIIEWVALSDSKFESLEAEICIPWLTQWIAKNRIESGLLSFDEANIKFDEYMSRILPSNMVHIMETAKFNFHIKRNIHMHLDSWIKMRNSRLSQFERNGSFSETVILHFFYQDWDWSKFIEYLVRIKYIFSFIFSWDIGISFKALKINGKECKLPLSIKLLQGNTEESWINFLFHSTEIDYITILQNYFSSYEKYSQFYDIYFSTKNNQFLHIENTFLNYTHGLDGLMWYLDINLWKTKENEHKIKLGKLHAVLTSDFWTTLSELFEIKTRSASKKFLKNVTLKGISFKEKIDIMCKYTGINLEWNDDMVSFRNIFSHGNSRIWIYSSIDKLVNSTMKAKLLFELAFLKAIKLEESMYELMVEHLSKRFQYDKWS